MLQLYAHKQSRKSGLCCRSAPIDWTWTLRSRWRSWCKCLGAKCVQHQSLPASVWLQCHERAVYLSIVDEDKHTLEIPKNRKRGRRSDWSIDTSWCSVQEDLQLLSVTRILRHLLLQFHLALHTRMTWVAQNNTEFVTLALIWIKLTRPKKNLEWGSFTCFSNLVRGWGLGERPRNVAREIKGHIFPVGEKETNMVIVMIRYGDQVKECSRTLQP